ncbi:acyl-CoA N-acyltransferase [Violaceomyces palustris]|uniref:Acyl-CoA N-acyltransferase n=1 Tax=Violaceomyces palustris TaxID=1673888 RepID=A0ACD0P3N5_9BASI|nr:acyl-CoA N-acyltransferase [Violaceomyces palustris]
MTLPPLDLPPSTSSLVLLSSSKDSDIYLRPPSSKDLQAVFDIHSDPKTQIYNPSGPDKWETSERRLNGWLRDWREKGIGYWVVVQRQQASGSRRESERIIGFTGLKCMDLPNEEIPEPSPLAKDGVKEKMLNIYYRYTPSATGKGVASTALRLALCYSMLKFPDRTPCIFTPVDNTPSRKLAERTGFEYFRDTEWAKIPHAEFRLSEAGRTAVRAQFSLPSISPNLTTTNGHHSQSGEEGRITVPLIISRLEESDIEAGAPMMRDAFSFMLKYFFPDGEYLPEDEEAIIEFRRSQLRIALAEEERGMGRSVLLTRADTGEKVGLAVWEYPQQLAKRFKEKLIKEEGKDEEFFSKLPEYKFPPRAFYQDWSQFKKVTEFSRTDALGETPHYGLRFLTLSPSSRNLSLGSVLLGYVLREGDKVRPSSLTLPSSSGSDDDDQTLLPWYLDSTPLAVPFYERHGFKKTEATSNQGGMVILPGREAECENTRLWAMIR